MQGIFRWMLLSKKLLRKHEEMRKHALAEFFPDRALEAVKTVQSREKAPVLAVHAWVRSARALDVAGSEADPSVLSSSAAELCV